MKTANFIMSIFATLCSLVHAALKTYSKPLIQAGGKPVLNGLDIPIVADSKSCTFVIGQIISNAIKYRKDNLQINFLPKQIKIIYLFLFRIMELEFLLRIYHACLTKASLEKTDAAIPSQPGLGCI